MRGDSMNAEHSSHGLVAIAMSIATRIHRDQYRHGHGEPYIRHPERVAKAIRGMQAGDAGERLEAIAWLHDVSEDGRLTSEDLRAGGMPPEVVEAVSILTRGHDETYFAYITRVVFSRNSFAACVKLADLADNMSDLKECSLKDKYRFAQHMVRQAYPMLTFAG